MEPGSPSPYPQDRQQTPKPAIYHAISFAQKQTFLTLSATAETATSITANGGKTSRMTGPSVHDRRLQVHRTRVQVDCRYTMHSPEKYRITLARPGSDIRSTYSKHHYYEDNVTTTS